MWVSDSLAVGVAGDGVPDSDGVGDNEPVFAFESDAEAVAALCDSERDGDALPLSVADGVGVALWVLVAVGEADRERVCVSPLGVREADGEALVLFSGSVIERASEPVSVVGTSRDADRSAE